MKKPLEVRYVPLWLAAAAHHYNGNLTNFESIVSKHDVKLYKLANNLLRAKFSLMRINDFQFAVADIDHQYSEDDALFALYGQNPEKKTIAHFHLTNFKIVDDGCGGILIVEEGAGTEPKNLIHELLTALDTYRGRQEAYGSDVFKRYLTSVTNDHINSADETLRHLVQPPVLTPEGGGDPTDGNNGAKPT